jgi:hypothetical protein
MSERLLERLPTRLTERMASRLMPSTPAANQSNATTDDNRVAVGLALGGLVAWLIALPTIDPRRYNDLGLVSAVGPFFWLALVVSVAGFVFAVRARRFHWQVALLALGVVVLILYATPSVVEGAARVEASYRHLGVSDHIARTGKLDRGLDAYFNWPGFFAMLGTLQRASGAPDLLFLARWAPSIAAFAYLAPVLLIARALSAQPRIAWLSAGVFTMVNWTGQDYLAPQTLGVWLMLCIAGVVMTVMRRTDDPHSVGPSARIVAPRPPDGINRLWVGNEGRRVRLGTGAWAVVHVLVALSIAAVVASHQLTPFMLILVFFALWLVGRTPHWQLAVGTAVFAGIWLVVPAWPFVSGHVTDLLGGLGSGGATANLGNRVASGSADHKLVVTARLAQSATVWLLAGFGTLVLIAQRRRVRAVVLLALAPFLLLPLQAYGGEMLIRVFLFGLPVVAFLVAVFLFSVSGGAAWRGIALGAVLVLLACTTVLTRYGNERGEHFSPAEVGTYAWVTQHTKPGATIVTFDQNTPWRSRRYATDTWLHVEEAEPGPRWSGPVTPDRVLQEIEDSEATGPAYVVYTRAQQAMAELSGNISAGQLDRTASELDNDQRFEVVHRNTDGVVWRVR